MKLCLSPIFLCCILVLCACQRQANESTIEGMTQGTSYHIKIVPALSAGDLESLHGAVEAALTDIDNKMSNYRNDSEISKLNQQKTSDWLAAPSEIIDQIEIARQVYQLTDGCYDLTVKPIFDLWGFSKHENRVPSQEEIAQVLTHVGMSKLETDKTNSRLRKLDPQLQIDLSSIAQGYSVGVLAKLLEEKNIENYLVEIGGEMKVKGHNATGHAWRVAIEKPSPFTREVQKVLEIHQQHGTAIMTAGTYRNFFEAKGHTYSHILNPKTGSPVDHHLLSVTVLHDDPTWADAWDTALLCVGETEAIRIAEAEHLKVLLIYQDGESLKEQMSKAFMSLGDDD